MEILKGQTLRTSSGKQVSPEDELPNKVVALYFSAAWCPPCQTFTPMLTSIYKELQERNSPFEVIYVPCDHSEEEMNKNMAEAHGQWLALPFNDGFIKELQDMFDIRMIPKLIVLKSNGDLITLRGRKEVQDRGIAAFRSWLDIARLSKTDSRTVTPAINEKNNGSDVNNADL